jgi:hypothetical protein
MTNPSALGTVTETPTVNGFEAWLATAKPRSVFVYAIRNVLDHKTPPETQALALLAREAFGRGQIELVQKRTNGPDSPFEYRAVMKREKRISLGEWNCLGAQNS